LSIRPVTFVRRRRRMCDDSHEPSYSLLVRVLALIVCAAIVAAAFVTSLAVFWRASNTSTVLGALFANWSDGALIILAGGLLLAAIGAVHLARQSLE